MFFFNVFEILTNFCIARVTFNLFEKEYFFQVKIYLSSSYRVTVTKQQI